MEEIDINEFKARFERGEVRALIDVRTAEEFAEFHVEGALNIPLDQVTPELVARSAGEERNLYLICRSGGRSRAAGESLSALQKFNLINVAGGSLAAQKNGLPIAYGAAKSGVALKPALLAIALGLALIVLSRFI